METMKRKEEGIWEVGRKEGSPISHKNYFFGVYPGVNKKMILI